VFAICGTETFIGPITGDGKLVICRKTKTPASHKISLYQQCKDSKEQKFYIETPTVIEMQEMHFLSILGFSLIFYSLNIWTIHC